jgi:acyl dehydratase
MADLSTLKPGDALPALTKPPITRTTLALFCGASNDHNPIHVDIDFAREAGMEDVFAHGMLSMAYLAQLLTQLTDQRNIRSYGVRFGSITHLQDEITCSGRVTDKVKHEGEDRLVLEIAATDQRGDVKLVGQAVITL